jgi:hypothetical protein
MGMSPRVSVCLDCTTTTEHWARYGRCWSRWPMAPKRAVLCTVNSRVRYWRCWCLVLDLAAADWLLASLAGSEVAAEVMRHRGDLYRPARLVQVRRVLGK